MLKRRNLVLEELLATESTYVDNLSIMKKYKEYLKQALLNEKLPKGYNPEKDLFGEIEGIYQVHYTFYQRIKQKFDSWVDTNGAIGVELAQFMHSFQLFSVDYVSRYDDRIRQYNEIENAIVRDKVKEFDAKQKSKLSLTDYLIMPIQRGPRYELLLKQILNSTPTSHVDYKEIEKAYSIIHNVMVKLNVNVANYQSANAAVNIFSQGDYGRLAEDPPLIADQKTLLVASRGLVSNTQAFKIIDLADPSKGKKKDRFVDLLLFKDILVAGNFVTPTCPPTDYYIPVHLLWISEKVNNELVEKIVKKKKLKKVNISVQSIRGPESEWLVAMEAYQVTKWKKDLLKLIPEINSIDQFPSGYRKGRYQYKKGCVYNGEWLDTYFHGTGKLSLTEKVFDGYWQSSLKVGYGTVKELDTKSEIYCGWKWENDPTDPQIIRIDFWKELEFSDSSWEELEASLNEISDKLMKEQGAESLSKNIQDLLKETEKAVRSPSSVLIEWVMDFIELDRLFGRILFSSPSLSFKFYMKLACKLTEQLISINSHKPPQEEPITITENSTPPKPTSTKDKDTLQQISAPPKATHSDPQDLLTSFELPLDEVLIKSCDCRMYQEKLSSVVGKFYLFKKHICFEHIYCQQVFVDVISIQNIADITWKNPNSLIFFVGEKKYKFMDMDSQIAIYKYLVDRLLIDSSSDSDSENEDTWEESIPYFDFIEKKPYPLKKSTSEIHMNMRENRGKRKTINNKDSFNAKGSKLRKDYAQLGVKEETKIKKRLSDNLTLKLDPKPILKSNDSKRFTELPNTLTKKDWDYLEKGSTIKTYNKGDLIIEEGKEHPKCIYIIHSGRCSAQKKIEGNNVTLEEMGDMILFGECGFLLDSAPTASVCALNDGVQISEIDGRYITSLFLLDPSMAGRFYSHLCVILARRINARSINKTDTEESKHSAASVLINGYKNLVMKNGPLKFKAVKLPTNQEKHPNYLKKVINKVSSPRNLANDPPSPRPNRRINENSSPLSTTSSLSFIDTPKSPRRSSMPAQKHNEN
uniref:DH domain-containing protein n=1 Tax=Arcella intermedia TaxID=1963864 RepID=A0A6B2KWN6_9EUKA